uniref:Putative ribonuclease H-like domain-containing protein n=1 Tax=Tanacetum cinerariifolium TaxID=118510 RepID=A0A699IE30_TANCI|nr:putative ribonuclease H-like domain-containing protein [Tanacetum cinerariifolium]
MLDSQVNDKSKTSVGYHAVPSPYTGNFIPPKPNLILVDVDEYVVSESVTNVPVVVTNEAKTSESKPKSVSEPLIKDWVSDSEDENETETKSKQRKPSFAKVEFVKPNEKVKSLGNLLSRKSIIGKPNTLGKTVKDLEYTYKHNTGQLNGQMVVRQVWNNTRKYEEIYGGYVAFGGDPKGSKITGKGKISTSKLDFKDVYFVKELKFNLFSVSQMCDKKNNVLYTDSECVVLSPNFKLLDESQVLLRVTRKNNMYNVDLKNAAPSGGLTCLFVKATLDESNLWHRRLGHINFKTINKLVKGNLVRGLPLKLFKINQTCVACKKGKQYRASCMTKTVSLISQPLQMLHMDLFGPTFVKSLMKKMYCLVFIDDFSRFSWVFLATKDETSEILKSFITGIENLKDLRVKVIRCDNGTEFKNRVMNQFCEMKDPLFSSSSKDSFGDRFKPSGEEKKKDTKGPGNEESKASITEEPRVNQEKDSVYSTNRVNAVSLTVNAASNEVNAIGRKSSIELPDDPNMPDLEDTSIFKDSNKDVFGVEADLNNMETTF